MKCQLTYLPFDTEDVKEEVNDIIDFFDEYDVECHTGDLSTLLEGDRDKIMRLVSDLYTEMDDAGKHFRLHVELLSTNGYS